MSIRLETVERVAVFRALQLGDMLCAVPMLRALRAGLPAASITLVGLPWAKDFATRFAHLIDDFIPFPGHPSLPEQPVPAGAFDEFVADMRHRRFDLVIQAHGSGDVTNGIVYAFGAQHAAGFCPPGRASPPGSFLPLPRGPEILRLTALAGALRLPECGTSLEFPLTAMEEESSARLLRSAGIENQRYVCIHPGARMPSRRWPVERFADVAMALPWLGLSVLLTGTDAEAPLAEEIERSAPGVAVNLVGRTTLGELACIVRDSQLLVSNDTGVSHIAAALCTPSVVVACGSEVERWAPLDKHLHQVLAVDVRCRPCSFLECPVGHPCATAVDSRTVIRAAEALIQSRAA